MAIHTKLAQGLLDLLPLVADQPWVVHFDGRIRNQQGACPLCAVINEIEGYTVGQFLPCGAWERTTGTKLTNEECADFRRIMDAADERTPKNPTIRKYLWNILISKVNP